MLQASEVRSKTKFADPENTDAKWRQHMALQGGLIVVVLTCLAWAIPTPQYDVRYVDRPVTVVKKVPVRVYSGVREIPSTYQSIYDKCIDSYGYDIREDQMKTCHRQAMEASSTEPKVKVVYRVNTYKSLFDNCNDNHDAGIQSLRDQDSIGPRQERIALCHKAAMEGSKFH